MNRGPGGPEPRATSHLHFSMTSANRAGAAQLEFHHEKPALVHHAVHARVERATGRGCRSRARSAPSRRPDSRVRHSRSSRTCRVRNALAGTAGLITTSGPRRRSEPRRAGQRRPRQPSRRHDADPHSRQVVEVALVGVPADKVERVPDRGVRQPPASLELGNGQPVVSRERAIFL